MNERSSFILGKDVFIKLINISNESIKTLKNSLRRGNYLPFETNEFIINYLISNEKNNNLLSPKTKVLSSKNSYNLEDMNKYQNETYDDTFKDLLKNFIEFNPNKLDNIKTIIIISQRVDGNLESFLREYQPNEEELRNAFIHISYLYYTFQKNYKMMHIDPKINNYTWQKLDSPLEITYQFDGDKSIIRNVNHLFYLTDLEFVYSPMIIKKNNLTYNFSQKYEWLNDNRSDLIIIPKISSSPYYDYNNNLYLGINVFDKIKNNSSKANISNLRMFAIDILILVKMILTFDYISYLPPKISNILNKYFTLFCALSENNKNYSLVSSSSFAKYFT